MKTPNPDGKPQTSGVKYWQSLDHLAETQEFKDWVAQEFPSGASELTADPVTRRHFVKIMSASFALAGIGLTGCRRPEEKIIPFTRLPENYVHGTATFYATSMPNRGSAMPLLVRANEGRPTKVEGNPQHPDSNGATDTYAQASILGLYDQDRSARYLKNGEVVSREAAIDLLRELALPGAYGDLGAGAAAVGTVSQAEQLAQKKGGQGLSFLVERSSSPSRERIRKSLLEKFPQATWTTYEPIDFDRHRQAATLAFDQPVQPYFHLDKAKVILSLDSDFLGGEQDSYVQVRRFAAGRNLTGGQQDLNRLYQVEGLFTLTGSNADHRLRIPSSQISKVASQIAEKILAGSGLPGRWTGDLLKSLIQQGEGLEPELVNSKWIAECANDLAAHKGECVVLAGHDQPLEVHLMALAMNIALGNLGKTLTLQTAPSPDGMALPQLAQKLNAGEVETLVIIGGNPVYNAPADLDWGTAQRKAKTVVRVGYYEDETSQIADWQLPLTHFLETWGDGRSADGTLLAQQPLIEPIFDCISELEVLARIAGLEQPKPHDVVRATFNEIAGDGGAAWNHFLHDGYLTDSSAASVEAQLNWSTVAKRVGEAQPIPAPNRERLELQFHRDYSLDDGRYNNNGWLQEWPDPITKITWENVIVVSYRTAVALGIEATVEHRQGNVEAPRVQVRLGDRSVEGPVWIQPGLADFTVGLALGYGRGRTGRVGQGAGFNAYQLRTQQGLDRASGATLTVMGTRQSVSTTQNHWNMEGRAIVREANLGQFREQPDFVRTMDFQEPPDSRPLYPNPLDVPGVSGLTPREQALHQWAMVIDLNTCVGCSACVMACQSENNIPIVGKEQVGKSREMHWLRIDRYFSGIPDKPFAEQVEDPQSVVQPMMCQHCESAPCENVCPVNATVHDKEGLNLMVYNRCVGTRYCSNNCPYKVRRFNFFDYNRRPLDALYKSPITSTVDGEWALWKWFKKPERGSLDTREWDLLKLAMNPDVTVRMRGVMEKCTFCIQRLEQSKIARKVQARDSGDVVVPDGAVKTACQQVCPAESITFGNQKDPRSLVSQRQADPRNYSVLEFLATRPRVTYLARVRNPNPAMPDYREYPLTTMGYAAHSGMPIGGHAPDHPPTTDQAGASHAVTEKGGH